MFRSKTILFESYWPGTQSHRKPTDCSTRRSRTAEPALVIGKLGSRLGPPIGGGLAQEHKKKSLDYSQFIRDFAAIKARKVIFTARCYASAVLAMGLCLSVSVCHKSEFY